MRFKLSAYFYVFFLSTQLILGFEKLYAVDESAVTSVLNEAELVDCVEVEVKSLAHVVINGTTYALLDQLGKGAFGTVFFATTGNDQNLKSYAIKIFHPTPEALESFEREKEMLSRLNPPTSDRNLSDNPFPQFIAAEKNKNGFYIVQEFVRGRTLLDLIRNNGALSEEKVIKIAEGVARGLAILHAQGLIHRDIKPDNIILEHDGSVRILDLGLTEPVKKAQKRLQETRRIFGTPNYITPEHAANKDVLESDDIWALGITLYRALTTDFPFGTFKNRLHALNAIIRYRFGDKDLTVPTIKDPKLRLLVEGILKRDPSKRIQTAEQALETLNPPRQEVINGTTYTLREEIGGGGFARVYRATTGTGSQLKEYAVKIFRAVSPIALESYSQERKMLEKYNPPPAQGAATVQIKNPFPQFIAAEEKKDGLFIVQEYVKGRNIAYLIDRHVRPTEEQVIKIIYAVARGLSRVHRNHDVHQDIKPNNIIMDEDGSIRLIDFGVARSFDEAERDKKSGLVFGTLPYMSPEHVTAESAEGSNDVWGLGMTLYHFITGKLPLQVDKNGEIDEEATMEKIVQYSQGTNILLLPSSTGLSLRLRTLIESMLLPDVKKRIQTIERVQEELEKIMADEN